MKLYLPSTILQTRTISEQIKFLKMIYFTAIFKLENLDKD